jgi:hypothetical protein
MMKNTNSENMRVTTAALLVSTQCYENYAFTPEGDVDGENPYWKAKGGSDYLILNVDAESTGLEIQYVLDAVAPQVETDNALFREYIIGSRVVPANFTFGDWRDDFLETIPNPRA